uniref:Uncharacterized protein n=1 Tax=Aureoumbra lagunensis TaxID=44058 RepID=A0A7S3K4H4_9STRA|mmetsp:Transcript_17518/g.22845  ORF Transcript_17518/g.22845 Transcript_17518/m.22845 type:complete len:265 (+) Transcript_17518:92-886(+)
MLDTETRARVLFGLCCALGLCGFLFLCVTWASCGCCYVDPCCVPKDRLRNLYFVNNSLCFSGTTAGLFYCFLAGWGTLLTLRRRASKMGFGHFFGAACVTFLVAVQGAGMWSAEAQLLDDFHIKKPRAWCSNDEDLSGQETIFNANHGLRKRMHFLFSESIIISIIIAILAPIYFISRDVYDDASDLSRIANQALSDAGAASLAALTRRGRTVGGVRITAYEPIGETAPADDERQYLGSAALPMRPIRPQFRPVDTGVHSVEGV